LLTHLNEGSFQNGVGVHFRFWLTLLVLLFGVFASFPSLGAVDSKTLTIDGYGVVNYSADKMKLFIREREAELSGNVTIKHGAQTLTADYAKLNQDTGDVHATGNIRLQKADIVMTGTELDYNVKSELGTVTNGSVSNSLYTLSGQLIRKTGDKSFQTTNGEYSTCKDCPKSWSLFGSEMDLEVEGYAFIRNMLLAINEVPVFYFPVLIFPVKTKRQSGFLFPSFGSSKEFGFQYLQPYYWAINDSQDLTYTLGNLSRRGWKSGVEYRFILDNEGSEGLGNFWALRDVNPKGEQDRPYRGNRWAADYRHRIQISDVLSHRLKYENISDTSYVRDFTDVQGQGDVSLTSRIALDAHFNQWMTRLSSTYHRGLLNPEEVDESQRQFPARTVQKLPELYVGSNRLKLLNFENGSFWSQSNLWVSRFWRPSDPSLGSFLRRSEPIYHSDGTFQAARSGERVVFNPSLAMDYRFLDRFVIRPKFTYHALGYQFRSGTYTSGDSQLFRGWPLWETALETTVERVYLLDAEGDYEDELNPIKRARVVYNETENAPLRALKHLITPQLIHNYIPTIHNQNEHPFLEQVRTPGGVFDENDIIPLSGAEVGEASSPSAVPLENSLSFGMTNMLIGRRGRKGFGEYAQIINWKVKQAIDLALYERNDNIQDSLSQFVSNFRFGLPGWAFANDYVYYPSSNSRLISASFTRDFFSLSRDIFHFRRSITLGYSYNDTNQQKESKNVRFETSFSFSDYFEILGGGDYSLSESTWYSWQVGTGFTHPGRCWQVIPTVQWNRDQDDVNFLLNLAINLTGDSLLGLSGPYEDAKTQ